MDESKNNSSLFSDIEHLGFSNIDDLKLYKKPGGEDKMKTQKQKETTDSTKLKDLLYDKEVVCPVCENKFRARAVKTSAARMVKKDSDFFIRYSVIDPYFYDVWLCNSCGYAAMKRDFENIKEYQIARVKNNITTKWRGREYPEVYDLDIAIERYKLSLLNNAVIEAKNSCKAMNCLKIAWMYRLKEDYDKEMTFLKQALEGFTEAYSTEDFPLYGMDRYSTMYLIGELYRRTGDLDNAMLWFSKVITTPSVAPRLKEMARDQKDLIKDAERANEDSLTDIPHETEEKKGFLKSIFKK